MQTERPRVQIRLTPRQQEEIRLATGKAAETLEFPLEELEERITPGGLTSN